MIHPKLPIVFFEIEDIIIKHVITILNMADNFANVDEASVAFDQHARAMLFMCDAKLRANNSLPSIMTRLVSPSRFAENTTDRSSATTCRETS